MTLPTPTLTPDATDARQLLVTLADAAPTWEARRHLYYAELALAAALGGGLLPPARPRQLRTEPTETFGRLQRALHTVAQQLTPSSLDLALCQNHLRTAQAAWTP